MESIHERKKPFKCEICDKSFPHKFNLNTHMSSIHEENKLIKCEVCDGSFATNSQMNKYSAYVHQGVVLAKGYNPVLHNPNVESVHERKKHQNVKSPIKKFLISRNQFSENEQTNQ